MSTLQFTDPAKVYFLNWCSRKDKIYLGTYRAWGGGWKSNLGMQIVKTTWDSIFLYLLYTYDLQKIDANPSSLHIIYILTLYGTNCLIFLLPTNVHYTTTYVHRDCALYVWEFVLLHDCAMAWYTLHTPVRNSMPFLQFPWLNGSTNVSHLSQWHCKYE